MNKCILCLLIMLDVGVATAREFKPDDYLQAFEHYSFADEEAVRALELAGLSDAHIFDPLEEYVLQYHGNSDDKDIIRGVMFALEGLSFSGNTQYRAAIEKAAFEGSHKKVKQAAAQALTALDQYAVWNPLINPHYNNYRAGYPGVKQRLQNMLGSGEDTLMLIAARRVYAERWFDLALLDTAAQSIEQYYLLVDDDASLDAMVWLMRATAGSRQRKYQSLLEKVMETTNNPDLRKYARKYLRYF